MLKEQLTIYLCCVFGLDLDDDLADVLDAVKGLAANWKTLAIHLHLKHSSLDVIQANYPRDSVTCLTEAMVDWLKKNYNVKKHGSPCWRSLVRSMAKIDKAQALRVADKH